MFKHKVNRLGVALILGLFTLVLKINIVYAQEQIKILSQTPKQEILFTNGKWKDVAAIAKKNGKYIFVDAYTSWCAPCRQLKNVTFKNKNAAAYFNRNFINYTIDMEKGEGVDLSEKWNVFAYPTLLFFNSEGKMVMKQTGYVEEKKLISLGKEAIIRK